MTQEVTIPAHFCGPPNSGNGGYTCGLVAGALGGSDIEVTLRAPPPLQVPLRVEHDGDEARLVDGRDDEDAVVAVARPVAASLDLPDDAPLLPAHDDVVAAAGEFDVADYRRRHEYPTCFTCGPDRAEGEGLRLFPGSTGRDDQYAWPWTPDAALADEDGELPVPVVWAALDCMSGQAWLQRERDIGAVVLGRMAARIDRTPRAGERLVVVGWAGVADGRKRPGWTAIVDESGAVLARSRATWVVLDDAQRAAFAGDRS